LYSANAVLASFVYFVDSDAAAILEVVLYLATAQIEQIIAADILTINLVFDVIASLCESSYRQQHKKFVDVFIEYSATPSLKTMEQSSW